MVNVRFSEQETCKIVELYRAYECLWNPANEHYRNRRVHRATCEAIARELNIEGFTAADVRLKLKILKGTYVLEKRKIKKFAETGESYVPRVKWYRIMDTFYHKMHKRPGNESTSENADQTSDSIIPEGSQWEQSRSNAELAAEIEQSIKAITNAEVVTVTPEIQALQSEDFAAGPGIQSVPSTLVTVTPDILTVKAVSNSEPSSVASGITEATSISSGNVSNPAVTTVPSGIQTSTSAPIPQLFALIPGGQASKSAPNNKYITIAPSNKQNVMYRGGEIPGILPRTKLSADETLGSRKRHLEDTGSTNSNNDEFSDRIEDEMDAFGHFVAMNLRKLSMQSSLSAQSEILSVLTRYRLKDSTANQPAKQIVPYILTNGSSPTQNQVLLQKVFLKN